MKSLRIKNFKCFEDKEILFSNLTILAGCNGAGKSSVIQSFLLLAQSVDFEEIKDQPKTIYLNDYYCELGNSERLLNYNADNENIVFIFENKNGDTVNITTSIDEKNKSTLHIDSMIDLESQYNALNFLQYFDFIGADRYGPKPFHHTDSNFSKINVGKYGEYTALILHNHKTQPLKDFSQDLLFNVNFWLEKIFGYVQVDTDYFDKANIAMINVKNHPKGEYESPLNMPYGVSYVLPIIVSCLVRNIPKNKIYATYNDIPDSFENEMIIIENPEAHLHPKAQSKLGYFLAHMSNYMQIIVETHSEHIINGIRLATVEEFVDQNNICINFFETNEETFEPNIINIKIDEMGDLSEWPEGFFDQQELDITTIIRTRMTKNGNR